MINRQEFVDMLKICMHGIDKAGESPQSDHFVFADGQCITYNHYIAIFHPASYIDFNVAVKAQEMFKLLNRIKAPEMDVSSTTSNKLALTTKHTRTDVAADYDITMPYKLFNIEREFKPICSEFLHALHSSMPVASEDKAQLALCNIYIQGNKMYACDGFKFIEHTLKDEYMSFGILPKLAKIVTDFKPNAYDTDGYFVYFKNTDNGAILCVRVEQVLHYPTDSFDKVFAFDGAIVPLKHQMYEMVINSEIFADMEEGIRTITIQTKEGTMIISGKGFNGTHKERIKIDSDVEISFTIDSTFFKSAVKLWNEIIVGSEWVKILGDGFRYTSALC
jgi:hypothetical protein